MSESNRKQKNDSILKRRADNSYMKNDDGRD